MWSHWIARAEYRYADFGTASYTDVRLSTTGFAPYVVSYDLAIRTHTATFGVAYKF